MANEVVIILIFTSILVAFLNLFCLTIMIYTKRLHKATHMAISSLLVAHFLQGILVIPSYAVKRAKISTDHRICDVFRFTYFLTNYASCLSLLVISLDRCFGVLLPLKYKVFITQKRMLIWLCAVWCYVLALCLIPFAPNDKTKCKYHPTKSWTLAMLLGHTMVPFFIILCCYVIIFSKIKDVLQQRRTQSERCMRTLARRKQWDKSKTTIIIVAFYIVCWGPSFVYYTALMLCPDNMCFTEKYLKSDAEEYVTFVMKLLTFIDGIIAPLLYCFNNASFSNARKRFVRQMKSKLLPKSWIKNDEPFGVTTATPLGNRRHVTMATEMTSESPIATHDRKVILSPVNRAYVQSSPKT
ncbi:alpha-1A adrenergic receptor-like [Clytia hemisphaerica]|uniref:alpha-1A adrenergic receptor-like n=1 Tax=Clytia hemisphaerica TaxID=252671 RepID=UPI0034D5BC1E|eukprot:TCONS_00029939-protein